MSQIEADKSLKLDIDLPVKGSFAQCLSSNLTHDIGKYDFGGGVNRHCRFGVNHPCRFWGGVNRTDDLPSNHQVSVTPNHLYDLPPPNRQGWFTPNLQWRFTPPLKSAGAIYPKSPVTIYPPPNRPILSKISNAHNIMLCFTKVFSAKDQKVLYFYRTQSLGER